jgi:hypothetical protein
MVLIRLGSEDSVFANGLVLTTAYMAKSLDSVGWKIGLL